MIDAEDIKTQVDCREFAERIGLRVNGKGFCCCPIHGEKTASLRIYPNGRGWYCFGCHKGGDVISLAQAVWGVSFKDAINQIALEYGLNYQDSDLSDSDRVLMAVRHASNIAARQKRKCEISAFEAQLALCRNAVHDAEKQVEQFAPKTPDEDFDARFGQAIMAREIALIELEQVEERKFAYDRGKY